MGAFGRIMVAFGRDATDGALALVARDILRAARATELHAVTVDTGSFVAGCFPAPVADVAAQLERDVRETVGAAPGLTIVSAVLNGPVLDALLAYARGQSVDLIIVGHHRDGPTRSLGRRLARHAPCSVLMVPDGTRPRIGRVLVPVDFSEDSGRALDAALDLCRGAGLATCQVLNVFASGDPEDRAGGRIIRGDEQREMERFLHGHDASGLQIETLYEDADDVVGGVMRVKARAGTDLICMSSRGRSRTAAVLLGSATEDVLDAATCPVLVVRAPGKPLSFLKVLAQRIFTSEDRPRLG